MKTKSIILALAGLMLAACAGEKNEVQADGAVLAVRTIESGEVTEVALLTGNFDTPEAAQAAAESAQWMPMSQFSQDDELDFVDASSSETIADANHERRFTPRDGRPNRGDNRFRDRDRDWDRAGNNNKHDQRHFGNHRPGQNWRPHHYNNHWQSRPWQRPVKQYWNYNRCHYKYIWYRGRCVLPRSKAYGYRWKPRYGYTYRPHRGHVNVVSSNWYVRLYF